MKRAFYISFMVSTIILTLCWMRMIMQCCVTSIKKEKEFKKTASAFSFCIIAITLNTIYYFSTLNPQYKLFGVQWLHLDNVRNFIEIVGIFIGTNIYRVFLTKLHEKLYEQKDRTQTPCCTFCIKYTPISMQVIVCVAALVFYACDYALDKRNLPQFFYIFLDYIILVILIIFVCIYEIERRWYQSILGNKAQQHNAPLAIDEQNNENGNNRNNDKQRQKLERHLKFITAGLSVAIILVLLDMVVIVVACDFMFDFTPWSYKHIDEALMSTIVYSTVIIMVNAPLFLWALESSDCCTTDQDAICVWCGCGCCCFRKNNNNGNREVIDELNTNSVPLESSRGNPAMRSDITTTNSLNRSNPSSNNIVVLSPAGNSNLSAVSNNSHPLRNPRQTSSLQPETIDEPTYFEYMNDK